MQVYEAQFFMPIVKKLIPFGNKCRTKNKNCPYWTVVFNGKNGFCGYCELVCAGDFEINNGLNEEKSALSMCYKICNINT